MNTIIANIRQIIKGAKKNLSRDDVLISFLLIVVSLASFSLGKYSNEKATNNPKFVFYDLKPETKIAISKMDAGDNQAQNNNDEVAASGKTTIFGSKSGKKYYFSWCSGANRVKLTNRVYYQTEQSAKSAGRSIASGCNK